MYLSHFGLNEQPFSIAPDPSFLYLSERHQEALGHLLYGAGQTGGFVALTGEVGTGKTTLVRTLLEQKLDNVDIALCLNPGLSVNDFVESLCDELGVSYQQGASLRQLSATLNQALLASHAAGRHSVAIIDEAQNLSREVLEQIRLLTNLETNKDKLLRIILVGQPELQQLLARNDLRQLAQRITARYHLGELSKAETKAYIQHRLSVAGTQNSIFTNAAVNAVYSYSAGTPRLINIICDRALTIAYAAERDTVTPSHIREAARELLPGKRRTRTLLPQLAALSFLLVICIVSWQLLGPVASEIREQISPSSPDAVAGGKQLAAADSRTEIIEPLVIAEAGVSAAPAPKTPPQNLQFVHAAEPGAQSNLDPLFEYSDAATDLLARWGISRTIGPDTLCKEVSQYQLRCLLGSASLIELRSFDRPAILKISRAGSVSWALLQAVDGDRMVLQTSHGLKLIESQEFDPYWTGEFQLLLRLPAEGIQTLRPGQTNRGVEWLREQIRLFDGLVSATSTPSEYDAPLKSRVETFQAANQLEADGVVGGQTLTLLQNLSPVPGTPLLKGAVD
jgi:general secretion pathway protein A